MFECGSTVKQCVLSPLNDKFSTSFEWLSFLVSSISISLEKWVLSYSKFIISE